MQNCWGDLITSESLRSLWICPCIRSLTLGLWDFEVQAEDIQAGLQHLRSAAMTHVTSVPYLRTIYNASHHLECNCPKMELLACLWVTMQAAGALQHIGVLARRRARHRKRVSDQVLGKLTKLRELTLTGQVLSGASPAALSTLAQLDTLEM